MARHGHQSRWLAGGRVRERQAQAAGDGEADREAREVQPGRADGVAWGGVK